MPDDIKIDARTMQGVIPYLGMDGRSAEAADFYVRAFAARDLGRMPYEDDPKKLMHCQVEINGGALMMSDMSDPNDRLREAAGLPPAARRRRRRPLVEPRASRPAAPSSCRSRRCSGATAGACSPTPSA